MKETQIAFETAKLAKEKGFIYTSDNSCYNDSGIICDTGLLNNDIDIEYDIPAPTQSLLQKWLREIHDVHFEIIPIFNVDNGLKPYHISVCKNPSGENFKYSIIGTFDTYEGGLEIALKEGLKLISI